MKVCDRSFNRDGTIKRAQIDLALDVGTFHLAKEEYDLIRDFILNPNEWIHISQVQNEKPAEPPKRRRGRPRKHPEGFPSNPA